VRRLIWILLGTCVACARSGLWDPIQAHDDDAGSGHGADAGASGSSAGGAGSAVGGAAGSPQSGAGTAGQAGAPQQYAVAVAAGSLFSCGRNRSGEVRCWGANRNGSLGLGDDVSRGNDEGELGDGYPHVDLGEHAQALAAGGDHACAVLASMHVKCWGRNFTGELGIGDTENRGDTPGALGRALPYVELGTAFAALDVTTGDRHSCALLSDASVKCWGENYSGQLGLGSREFFGDEPGEMHDDLPRVELGASRGARAVDAGAAHTCAVLDDQSVKCWGSNDYGQLGLGDARRRGDGPNELGDALAGVDLGTAARARHVVAGGSHSCAVLESGALKCWGNNTYGQLGLGDVEHRGDQPNELGDALPEVELGARVEQVALGDFHTCALLETGKVRCFGYGRYGQLGRGDSVNVAEKPGELAATPDVDLGAARSAVAITSGGYHVCAVLDDDSIKCWGWNLYGQLGIGDDQNRGDDPEELGDALPPVDLNFR
jgi:alpha-tubulin suppressor-like RCC1 family protein